MIVIQIHQIKKICLIFQLKTQTVNMRCKKNKVIVKIRIALMKHYQLIAVLLLRFSDEMKIFVYYRTHLETEEQVISLHMCLHLIA